MQAKYNGFEIEGNASEMLAFITLVEKNATWEEKTTTEQPKHRRHRRKSRKFKHWTAEETKFLYDNKATSKISRIAKKLGRTTASCYQKLNLDKKKLAIYKGYKPIDKKEWGTSK